MVQINQKTKYERPIGTWLRSKNGKKASSEWFAWQWEDEANVWLFYSPKIMIEIEKAYKKNSKGDYNVNVSPTQQYSIDFQLMKQTNLRTKFVRDVRRQIIGKFIFSTLNFKKSYCTKTVFLIEIDYEEDDKSDDEAAGVKRKLEDESESDEKVTEVKGI